MAYIRKENRAEKMSDVAIYVILSPFGDKKFYISHTGPNRMRKTYTEHQNLRVVKTKNLFLEAREKNFLPPFYLLENRRMSDSEKTRRSIAWVKYFKEHGYIPLCDTPLTKFAEEPNESTKRFYSEIEHIPLDEVLIPNGGLFSDYKRKNVQPKTPEAITVSFILTGKEYEGVKAHAKELKLSLASYCKKMTLNGRIVPVDFYFLQEYLNEFSSSKKLLQQILASVYSSRKFYPADLETIQSCIDHLTKMKDEVNIKLDKTIRTLNE